MNNETKFSWCINTWKTLCYLKLAVQSIRENAYYKNQPIIIFCENDEETYEWLKHQDDIETIYEENTTQRGIGGGINECVKRVKTEFFSLIHSDFFISRHYDRPLYDIVSSTEKPVVACSWRLEPNIFNNVDRLGTIFCPPNTENGFGTYHHDFKKIDFLNWADEFVKTSNAPDFRKVEGVSYMMRTKYFVNNSEIYSPTSLEDHDQSIRMQMEGYDFVVTGKALTWHFGARSSHFLGQHDKLVGTSERQKTTEARNHQRWKMIWNEYPSFDEVGFVKVTDNMREIYNKNRDKYLTGDYSNVIMQ
jgi:GT2 family glycosyltransferase